MSEPIRLGIAGLGTVGAGVMQLLETHGTRLSRLAGRAIVVEALSARDEGKRRKGVRREGRKWFKDAVALAGSPDIDVFVELIGGEDGIAREAIEAALGAGKHVVTANKALLAHHGAALAVLAERHGVALSFEAAVAGGIPIVKAMRESLLGNEITRVYGILNGTCNYILTRMQEEGRPFAEVLAEAQALGYAEADPSFDVGGTDAAHKLSVLASLAFGVRVAFDHVYIEGIEEIVPADFEAADELGYRIKLLGVALKTEAGIEQRVHPTMVPKRSAIAEVGGVTNCVAVDGDYVGNVMMVGPGAGAGPTASSVVGDVVDIARGVIMPPFITPAGELVAHERARMRAHAGGYYIRLSVFDRPGAFAAIAERMAEHDVSLESIVQRRPRTVLPGMAERGEPGAPMPVVMITHQTTEDAIGGALEAIESDGHVAEKPRMIRIEKL